MSKGLLCSRATKERLFSKKLKSPSFTNQQKFRDFNSMYFKLCRVANKKYYHDKFLKNANNIKFTWQTIKEVMGCNKPKFTFPKFFEYKGSKTYNSNEIAN